MIYLKRVSEIDAILYLTKEEVKALRIRKNRGGDLEATASRAQEQFDQVAKQLGYQGFDYYIEPMTEKDRNAIVDEGFAPVEVACTIVYCAYIQRNDKIPPDEKRYRTLPPDKEKEKKDAENNSQGKIIDLKKWTAKKPKKRHRR